MLVGSLVVGIFATPFGTPLDPADARKRLRAVLKAAGVPEYTFHALRHAAATMMLAAGVNPKVAAPTVSAIIRPPSRSTATAGLSKRSVQVPTSASR